MAAQFDQARVTYQPTPAGSAIGIDTFDRQSAFLSSLSAQQSQESSQLIAQSSAAFGTALDEYNKIAVDNAQHEAPAAVTRDGNGMLVAPSSFYPTGLHSRAYAEAFKSSYEALYQQTAASDFTNESERNKVKFANDPTGYSTAMEAYRSRMVAGLSPEQAPFIDLRLKQIAGQGATQVSVSLQAQNNEANKVAAEKEIASIIDTASRSLRAVDTVAIDPSKGFADVTEMVVNDAILGKRLAGAEAQLARAGYGPDAIKQRREEIGFKVSMANAGRDIRDKIMIDQQAGVPDGTQIAQVQKSIYDYAAKYPGKEAQIIEYLNGQLSAATTQSSRVAQGIQLRQEQAFNNKAVENKYLDTVAADPTTPPEQQQVIRNVLRQRALDALADPTLNDNMKLRYASSAAQSGAISAQAYSQAISTKLIGLTDTANNPESRPEQRVQAERELKAIVADPDVRSNLTPEQMHYARQTIAEQATRRIAGNLQVAMIQANDRTDPLPVEAAKKIISDGVANGTISDSKGVVSMGWAAQLMSAATTNDVLRTTDLAQAAKAVQNRVTGIENSPTEIAAAQRRFPYRNPAGPGMPWNGADPAVQQTAIAHLDKWQYLPQEAQDWISKLPHSQDPAVVQPYLDFYAQLMRTAEGMGYVKEAAANKVAKWIGSDGDKTVRYMRDAADTSIETAAKSYQGASNSQTANQGNPNPVSDAKLDAKIDNMVNTISGQYHDRGIVARLRQWELPLTKTPDDIRADKLFGGYTAAETGPYVTPAGKDSPMIAQEPTSASVAPDLRAEIASKAAELKANDGAAVHRMQAEGGDVDGYYVRKAYDQMGDSIERHIDPNDPTKVVIGYRQFASAMTRELGVSKIDLPALQGLQRGIVASLDKTRKGMWMPYDQGSLSFDPARIEGGKMVWKITAKSGANIVDLGQIAQDDKRISGLGAQLARTASTEASAWFGSGDDRKRTAATTFGSLFSSIVTDRFSAAMHEDKVLAMARSIERPRGWEDSWVDTVRAVKDIWETATGAPTTPDEAAAFKKAEEHRASDAASAAQIERFGLMHNFFWPKPDMQLLPQVGHDGPRIGIGGDRFDYAHPPPLPPPRNQIPGSHMTPYQPYDYSKPQIGRREGRLGPLKPARDYPPEPSP